MLEKSGKWRGFVHVFDLDLRKANNHDVIVSGARFDFESFKLLVAPEDVFVDRGPWVLFEVRRQIALGLVN